MSADSVAVLARDQNGVTPSWECPLFYGGGGDPFYVTLRCVTSRHIVSRYVTLYYFTVGGVAGRGSSVVFWVGSGLG